MNHRYEKGKATTFPFSKHSDYSIRQSQAVLENNHNGRYVQDYDTLFKYNLAQPVMSIGIWPEEKNVRYDDAFPTDRWKAYP